MLKHRMLRFFALLFAASMAACAGGGGTTTAPSPTSIQILYGFMPSMTAQLSSPAILYDEQFFDPAHDSYFLATVPQSALVTWSIAGSSATLSNQEPGAIGIPADPAPTAPPGTTFIAGADKSYGKSVVTASLNGATATLVALHYPSLSLGCQFRYQPAFAFDPDRIGIDNNPSTWTAADLFVTAPAASLGILDPCFQSPLALGNTTVWHTPFGGVLLPMTTLTDFVNVRAAQWQASGTTFSPAQSGVLLFKTAEGRLVKVAVPIGPYEVTTAGSDFTSL